MSVTTSDLTTMARAGGYAIAAFNIFDHSSLSATINAAEEVASPVIVQVSVRTASTIGMSLLSEMFRTATKDASIPAVLHLDHCPDLTIARAAIDAGWNSVLFDASHLDYSEAATQTQDIVNYAHRRGAEIESEIENIAGTEDGVGGGPLIHSYSNQDLIDFAQRQGVDLIAPHLGTAHGVYKDKPQLRYSRVAELREMTRLPIVLHGGTGLSDSEYQEFITAGVSKINISTDLKHRYVTAMTEALRLAAQTNRTEPLEIFDVVEGSIRQMIITYLTIFGSAGKA